MASSGPLKVSHLGHHCAMSRAFVQALQEQGVPYNPDFNGARQAGVGFMQHTIDWTRAAAAAPSMPSFAPPTNPKLTSSPTPWRRASSSRTGGAPGVEVEGPSGAETFHADSEVISRPAPI